MINSGRNHSLDEFLINKKNQDEIKNLSNVVYLIKCKECNKIYIGETGRRLENRIYEYERDCRI